MSLLSLLIALLPIAAGNIKQSPEFEIGWIQVMRGEGRTIQAHSWEGMIYVFSSNLALLHAAWEALDENELKRTPDLSDWSYRLVTHGPDQARGTLAD